MQASDFARDDCQVGQRRISYRALQREWVCDGCGGRLVLKPHDGGWRVACGRCGGTEFVHEVQAARERYKVMTA